MRKCSRTGDRRSVHIVSMEEQAAFAEWINTNLAGDPRLATKLSLDKSGEDLYEKMDDGDLDAEGVIITSLCWVSRGFAQPLL